MQTRQENPSPPEWVAESYWDTLTATKTVQKFDRLGGQRLRFLNRSTNSRETDSARGYEFEEMENNSDAISLVPTNFACFWI
mmetsp:Transcript_30223/g.51676  ORF Transcript_30223/g.51676 Transcript_30223/m.51676 type:complete len:82 (+) Transcript_30223:749-994(+)